MKKKIIAIISVLVIAAAACAGIIAVKNRNITADPQDHDAVIQNTANQQIDKNNIISKEEALEKAVAHANVDKAEINVISNYLNKDNGIYEYDIEFIAGGKAYEYEIHAATGAVTGCDIELIKQDPTTKVPESKPEQTTKNEQPIGVISTDAALDIALKHAGLEKSQVKVIKNRFDDDGHIEIEFRTAEKEYDYEISATSAKVLECDVDYIKTTAPATTKPDVQNKNISRDEALKAALDHAGIKQSDAKAIEVEFDGDDRIKHYDVEFRFEQFEYEYEINAENGKVISHEREFDR